MTKRTILIIIVVLIISIGLISRLFIKKGSTFTIEKVIRGNVVQSVSATGQVKMGDEINLSFANSGKIEKIYVKVGDEVGDGQKLAKLDTSNLSIQLTEAQANAEAQKAKLMELESGARPEEIQIVQTQLNQATTGLDNLYQDTSDILNQAYNLADYAIRQRISALFLYRYQWVLIPHYDLTYNYCDSQAGIDAKSQREISETELNNWRNELQNLGTNYEILDGAINDAEEHLSIFQNFLNRLNDTFVINCSLSSDDIQKINNYKSAANLASIDINTALTSVSNQQKAIDTQKLTVQSSQEQLNLKLAGSRSEDIAYQEALVRQAEANVALLEKQIQDATLSSPTAGQVTDIGKNAGEMIQPAESLVSLIAVANFQSEVDVPEVDIGKVSIGNSVQITLDAFPETEFSGKVVEIDPAETVIQGVVYYKVRVTIETDNTKIKPGMTANVTIISATKENVLIVPQRAVIEKEGKKFVRIPKDDNTFQEIEVGTGLKGVQGEIEITSGLKEGDKVITFIPR